MLINHGGRNIHHDGRNIHLSSRRPVAVENHKFKQGVLVTTRLAYASDVTRNPVRFWVSKFPETRKPAETSGNPEYNFQFADVTSLNLHPEDIFVSLSIVSYPKVRLMYLRFPNSLTLACTPR